MEPKEALVRIHLRYPDEETFVLRFAPNVTRGGIFLASRKPRPVGEVIRFAVSLSNGPPLLWGSGRVTWVREFNPAEPHRAHGMGVQFLLVEPACRPLLDRLLAQKVAATPAHGEAKTPRQAPASPAAVPAGAEAKEAADAAEALDDAELRRLLDRARGLASRVDVEALLIEEPTSPPTREQALADLPRLLSGRRASPIPRAATDEPSGPVEPQRTE